MTFLDPPKPGRLANWRNGLPKNVRLSTLAWQVVGQERFVRLQTRFSPQDFAELGLLRPSAPVRAAWERTVAAAHAMGAEIIVLETPPVFTPSVRSRDTLRRFVDEVIRAPRETAAAPDTPLPAVAWEPRGMWEPGALIHLAQELDLVPALDPLPLEEPPPACPRVYLRVRGLGVYGGGLDERHLDRLVELAQGREDCWIVFANARKFADAQRFAGLLANR